jgi:hypothetical protein
MPRKSADAPPTPPARVIDPNGVYFVEEARQLLHLRGTSIRREVRQGRLRVSKRCGRYYLLGRWLLEWIERGELVRKENPAANAANGAAAH